MRGEGAPPLPEPRLSRRFNVMLSDMPVSAAEDRKIDSKDSRRSNDGCSKTRAWSVHGCAEQDKLKQSQIDVRTEPKVERQNPVRKRLPYDTSTSTAKNVAEDGARKEDCYKHM